MTGKKWTIIEGLACNVFRLKLVCKVVKYYLNPISQFSTVSTIWITLFKFKWKKKSPTIEFPNAMTIVCRQRELSYTHLSKATEKDVLEEQQVIYSYIYFFLRKSRKGYEDKRRGCCQKVVVSNNNKK